LQEGHTVVGLRHRNPIDVDGVEEATVDLADARAVEELVAGCQAIVHLATCKEDREGVIDLSARGTFNLLEAAKKTGSLRRFLLASGDAVQGIYFNPQPLPLREDMPMAAYPGYYPLSKVIEETLCRQYFVQEQVPTVCLRMSWVHAEDDILTHLTVAGEPFGVPVWSELMDEEQRADYGEGKQDAVVALRHPNQTPMQRHIVAVEDCVQAFLLALRREGIEGETFQIAMDRPFDYVQAATYVSEKLALDVLQLVDPVGHDFCIDVSKAEYVLGYRPQHNIFSLIDTAIEFRREGRPRRRRSGYAG
jgi:nucleoside-diphosphate-sugar epimerase